MIAPNPRALTPRRVISELNRLGLTEWSLIKACGRADRCSVSACPFDPLIALRSADPSDRETRCPASKPDRERFFARMSPPMQALLPFGGLYETEWTRREAGRRRQASLSPEQRERQRALLAANRAAPFAPRTSTATKPSEAEAAPHPTEGPLPAKAGANGGEAA